MTQFLGRDITTPLTIVSNQPEFVGDTLSLRRVTTRRTAQRWELEFGLAPDTTGELAGSTFAHRNTMGGHTVFSTPMPLLYNLNNTLVTTGNLVNALANNVGVTSFTLTHMPGTTQSFLNAMFNSSNVLIQFSGSNSNGDFFRVGLESSININGALSAGNTLSMADTMTVFPVGLRFQFRGETYEVTGHDSSISTSNGVQYLAVPPTTGSLPAINVAGANSLNTVDDDDRVQTLQDVPGPGEQWSLLAGSFFTFGNHPKVYQITQSVTSPGSDPRAATVNIYPGLVSAVPINTPLNFTPDINVRYDLDSYSYVLTGGIVDTTRIRLIEAL